MKRFTLLAAIGLVSMSLSAQEAKEEPKEEGFVFTTVKELPITSIKNQSRAGTCWCYSSMAFLESELLRMGKGEYDLSEMYIVHQTYLDRADAAVRTHGDVSFSQGGSFYDVLYGMKKTANRRGRKPSLPFMTFIWVNAPKSSLTKGKNILLSHSTNQPD